MHLTIRGRGERGKSNIEREKGDAEEPEINNRHCNEGLYGAYSNLDSNIRLGYNSS
jgi:hypothetical protein